MKQGWQGALAPERAGTGGGTAFALDLFGQAGAVEVTPQRASAQGGMSELSQSGTAANDPLQTGATGGEISPNAVNGSGTAEDAAANGLPGADAAEGELAQAGIRAGELAQADAGIDAAGGQPPEGEAEVLLREMRAQYGLPEAGAAELLAAFGEDRARGQHIREQAVRQAAFRGVMGEYLSMLREADGLRARYAGFSLPELLEDARFLGMLRAGLSMEDAYLAMHGREVLRQAIAATHRWTETQLRAQWAAESRRPAEGAMTGGSTALSRTNPAQMTRAQREAIARRVLKGERVLL